MHEMDTNVKATCPDNWGDSDIVNPDMVKEEGFHDTIKSEPELEENDLHDYPTAIKNESVEHSDGTESEVEAISPYTIKEGVSVAFKSESELEGNELDDDPMTIKDEGVEPSDGTKPEIEASSPYTQEYEDIASSDSIKEESCEDKYEASWKPEAVDSPNEYDSDLASSISVKEEAIKNDNESLDDLNILEAWPEYPEDNDDNDDLEAAVVLVPRLPSGPPDSGGAQQQMYETEPESPTCISSNRRRKHGVVDLDPLNDQPLSNKRVRMGDDTTDEDPVSLYAPVFEDG